jgi:NlpC/P60 family
VPSPRVLLAVGVLALVCPVVGAAGIGAVLATPLSVGASDVGALHGPAVPPAWSSIESAPGCPGLPASVLGALGFVASGSGRWADRPPPWSLQPAGPLGAGASGGPLLVQLRRSVAAVCWLVGQQGLRRGLLAVTGSPHEVDVVGVLAAGLEQAPLLSASRAQALAFAASAMGTPYRWGGNGPDAYDCSGLMVAAWASAGIHLPRTAQGQHDALADARGAGVPGDLVFYGSSAADVTHVGMWVRPGVLLDAPHTGAVVRLDPMDVASAVGVGSVG